MQYWQKYDTFQDQFVLCFLDDSITKRGIVCLSEFRDQGLTRPKVLIVVPFRESAKRIVEMMIQLLNPTDQVQGDLH